MDLHWSGPYGIVDGAVAPRTLAFIERHGHRFGSVFVSWQPAHKGLPRVDDVVEPWNQVFSRMPHARRCLHHTALNLAGAHYDRTALLDFTNALIETFGFDWVNEDLGHWSTGGWPLPYPQPPKLDEAGIAYCARVCREVDDALIAPLVVEFPGYERLVDPHNAYTAFCEVIERSGCVCNLDTGHLLTWRWLNGHRGEALLDGLEQLPLEHCIEIHLAGLVHSERSMIDAHHGVLAPIQLELARRLMELCPNLERVTYEDPRFDAQGVLPEPAERSLDALESLVDGWLSERPCPTPRAPRPDTPDAPVPVDWEADLQRAFVQPDDLGRRLRKQVLDRSTRGVGKVSDLFHDVLPDDVDSAIQAFLRAPEGRDWSAMAWAVDGRALEDAFGSWLAPQSDAHLLAVAKLLAVHPDPPFSVPQGFRRGPRAWFAIGGTASHPTLFASTPENVVSGAITPFLVSLLDGERPAGCEPALAQLRRLGLL